MDSDGENGQQLAEKSIDSDNFKGLEPSTKMDTDGENEPPAAGSNNSNNNNSNNSPSVMSVSLFTSSSSGEYTDISSTSTSSEASDHSSISSGSSNSGNTEQYSSFLRLDDSKDLVENQLEHFMELNKRNLENINLEAFEECSTRLFFHFCKKTAVEGVVRLHAIELYYRWLSAVHQEVQNLPVERRPNFEQRLKNETFIRMATCIQLASKYVGGQFAVGFTLSVLVTARKLRRLLAKFDCKVSYQDLRDSEVRVFTALNYNLNTLTPLEILGHILSLLEDFNRSEFHNIFSFCVSICYLTYTEKKVIYNDFRKRVLKKYATTFTDKQIFVLEHDYTLRAVSIIQAAMFLHQLDHPDVPFLQKLESIIKSSSSWQHIYELGLSIFAQFVGP